ncbi:MAG: division/cell wall cluster transcriptional repressor MraZ [Bdellovibrionota bacterium]
MSNLKSHGQFRGRFEIKLDPKGRLSLPPAYRQIFNSDDASLIITNSRYRGKSCLHAFSLPEWEKLERRISRMSQLKTEVQAFSRFYLSGGQAVELDAQKRILVPQSLRRFAGLEGEAVLVGLGDKFEIWSQDNWNSIYDQLTENFEDTLSAVATLDRSNTVGDDE